MPHVRVFTPVGTRSRTKQAFASEADAKAIVNKYKATGDVNLLLRNRAAPRYGDFTTAEDYLSALVKVRRAQELFLELPSSIRTHVRNDPAELLRLVFDPSRKEEAVKVGLISEAPVVVVEPVVPAEPVAPVAPAVPV